MDVVNNLELALDTVYLRIDNETAIAALALILYEYFITLDQEIELFWFHRWSWITWLFLVNRYIVPILQLMKVVEFVDLDLSSLACHVMFLTWNWGAAIFGATVEGALLLRIYALYGKSRPVLVGLLALGIICVGATFAITGGATSQSYSGLSPAPSVVTCYALGNKSWFYTFFIPSMIFDTTIFILTLVKTLENVRNRADTPLCHVLSRDGLVYFAVMFVMMLSNIGTIVLAPVELATCLSQITLSVISIMGSRLLLNLRGAVRPLDYSDHRAPPPSTFIVRVTTKDSDMSSFSEEGGYYGEFNCPSDMFREDLGYNVESGSQA